MNQVIALMIAHAIQSSQPLTVNQLGQPCEQVALYQCIPLTYGDHGSIAPTATAPVPARIFINTPAQYDIFNQPQY